MNTPTPPDKEWSEAEQRFAALLQEPKIVTPACYESEALLDLIADKSNTPGAAEMWAHITGCAHCAVQFAALSKAYQMAGKPSLAYRWRYALRVCRMSGERLLRPELLGMNRYQWTVLFAAWLGWGFDMFDATLFTQVAEVRPNPAACTLRLFAGFPVDGHTDIGAAAQLGGGRCVIRVGGGSDRTRSYPNADHTPIRHRHSLLRVCAQKIPGCCCCFA